MFWVLEREKDTIWFEQWYHAIANARRNFNEQLVRAVITKSCVGDAADAICCLLPGATLDDILKKSHLFHGLQAIPSKCPSDICMTSQIPNTVSW